MTTAGERELFHFTHIRNLRDILTQGCMVSDLTMQARGGVPVECGDRDIKKERRSRLVTVPPGGVVADYVPFYFAPRSPMMYKINCGKVLTYSDGQPPLVYLTTTVGEVVTAQRPYAFSDGNCANTITHHFNELERMAQVIDWRVIAARYWSNTTDDGDRKRRRMAEFLVHDHLPMSAITGISTYDRQHADRVGRLLGEVGWVLPVTVRRDWYY
ncbi:DUF4433 domain-containing protein [Streptomyces sp. NPDC021020]|uniref:type II toxin-antitoxin system toxin DNA ADP-ribosyl transferase DarT n=1 Tax=Streptomyces sp. NPDC021020 TaxID=3365109 RepID=UPI0037BB243C